MSNRSRAGAKARRDGHKLETDIVNFLAEHFNLEPYKPKEKNQKTASIGSSRMFSKRLDDLGIDIWIDHPVLKELAIQANKQKITSKTARSVELGKFFNADHGDNRVLWKRITVPKGSLERELEQVIVITPELFIKLLKAYVNQNQADITIQDKP